ncbi:MULTISPECIES: flagella synthesis protein FlgN [Yersinia pseudotuberculosis complex]|uniref:Flagella synthesis protein FlgN n=3 Tax=Yersinia pseudotuberculosis complex TaxID=1649845 RepID=A0A0U1QXP1_YERP3|nr:MULTISPECIES: flagella synthesis protein FlgN [Yersinia pseudotuberculosis complex]ABS47424.1 flagella synthesis protein FlgN [Yersinia pseudotuberculosis IP 31758]AJK17130.1 flgN family protein [Yersinia pseudotuberculosis str. PA3606]AYW88353.1 flagellar biosynthesis protein FlgN [Yersinia pseudotuberculosis]AYW99102.1 flagellar biosynthesis protein FlgN [Yersinia pseudotuberculosis]AZA30664.1 flagellar biosynthesis protein FlgN [Yersinia pseudotuberculosis]
MVESLQTNLDQQLDLLESLTNVVAQEQQLLCSGRIQGWVLQGVTEQKSSILATLAYLDQTRITTETTANIQAPYPHMQALAERWQRLLQLTERLRYSNLHNGLLLQQHIEHNNQALAVLNTRHGQSLYGPDGQAKGANILGRKIGI